MTAIKGISHVAIAVPDIAGAAAALEKKLGLKAGPIHENAAQGVRLAYIDLGNARIELISPISPDAPLNKFLEKNPSGGLHHVAFNVADIEVALADAAASGARQTGKTGMNVHGERIAFLHPKDLLGALVELEEKH
jgi:methylmalonyl-CoA/ethylmalonyl-CoA epimerase